VSAALTDRPLDRAEHLAAGPPLTIRPVALPVARRSQVARRTAQAGAAAARHLAPLARRAARRAPLDDRDAARALRAMFEELAGSFSKFGQLLASSPSLFGDEVAAEFRGMLDAVPTVAWDEIRAVIEDELGLGVDQLFASIEHEPIAAASLAQVHRATLPDGRVVAVKVLRPGVEEAMAVDLAVATPLFRFLGHQIAVGIFGELPTLVSGLAEQLAEEVDLRNEARTMRWFEHLRAVLGLDALVVPQPVEGYTARRVLAMTFIEGVPIDDLDAIAELGVDPTPLVQDTVKAWFATALCTGAFHGDVHAGNLVITPDHRLGVLDWGIVGRLDPATQQFFRRVVEGVLGDEHAWPEVWAHTKEVYGPEMAVQLGLTDEQGARFLQLQMEPLFHRPFGEVRLMDFILNSEALAARVADGSVEAEPRSTLSTWRAERRRRRDLDASGATDTAFDRGTFLLGKQLVYFDRYGKLFLPDVPLLWDRGAFERLLAEPVLPAGGGSASSGR
jgi:aarF domain-containing kinase